MLNYRKATIDDIDTLILLRKKQLVNENNINPYT